MAFEIVWEIRGAYKRFRGHVTDEELLQSSILVEGDSRFDSLRYVINDFLAVESYSVSEAKVRIVSAIDAAAALSNPHIRIAIVATDQQIHALAELYVASPLNAYPTQIFGDIEDARAWLAVPSVLSVVS